MRNGSSLQSSARQLRVTLHQHSRNTHCIGSGRRADWPELEQQLHGEFKEQRAKGLKVKAWWFKNWHDQLFRELCPTKMNGDGTIPFLISKHWFERFQNRFYVSLRATMNNASEEPERKLQLAHEFHASNIGAGEFSPEKTGNMDQTPLPFDLNSGKTYADKGSKTVWCRSAGGSGLDKRQATVHLTIFGDGMPRTKPLVIFRGTGQRMTQAEKQDYDHRGTVKFHPNAWCDETMFLFWARHMWRRDVVTPKMLVLDSHRAQITNNAGTVMEQECNTTVITIGGGLTPVLQPPDVLLSKPFKTRVDDLFNEHLTANLDA